MIRGSLAGQHSLRIVQVSTGDQIGGAETSAYNLFNAYRERGHVSRLVVGFKAVDDPDVIRLPYADPTRQSRWASIWLRLAAPLEAARNRVRGTVHLYGLVRRVAEPRVLAERWTGLEDFNYPGSWRLFDVVPERPDVVHCHNLHGGYFDLRALPWLSQQVPLILNLHDAWPLSGHCAHSFECERWRTGCGQCPDLTIYPAIPRDATAENWRRKRDIYAQSRLYITTPSRWLMDTGSAPVAA